MAKRKTYRAKSKKTEIKESRNKKLSLALVASTVVLLSLYFGMIKARIQIIQEIYIWGAFLFALVYVFCATYLAFQKEKHKDGDISKSPDFKKVLLIDSFRRILLLLLIPMLFAILIDYMLLFLGAADYFGI